MIYQTLKTSFNGIFTHFEVRQKKPTTHRIFNILLGVWNGIYHLKNAEIITN